MRTIFSPTSPKRFDAGYDCELPPNLRRELLLRPQRARILVPPPSPPAPQARAGWMRHPRAAAALGLAALVLIVALAAILSRSAKHQPSLQVPSDHEAPPVVQTTPAPTASREMPAPRAVLVPVPVRRATLFRLPGQELGVYKWYELPPAWGGGSVWARYMGTKERFSQIPPGPIPGDLWNVTETGNSWIFCIPIGYSHAAWIDP